MFDVCLISMQVGVKIILQGSTVLSELIIILVPTWTGKKGKSGKMGEHFPVGEISSDWNSQGTLPKILKGSGNFYTGKLKKVLKKSGKFVSQ